MTNTASGPLRQGKGGQFADAATVLVLLFATLFVTTFVFAEGEGGGDDTEVTPISQLDISEAEKEQFELMKTEGMVDDETVASLVEANAPDENKYKIEWLPLIGIVGLAALYLAFVYAMSFREYREVIATRFGQGDKS